MFSLKELVEIFSIFNIAEVNELMRYLLNLMNRGDFIVAKHNNPFSLLLGYRHSYEIAFKKIWIFYILMRESMTILNEKEIEA